MATSLSRLIFYPRPTVIYVPVFLPSVDSFYKKLLSNITKLSLKKNFSFVGFLFSFKLQIILNYRSRCVSITFLEGIYSYWIRLVLLSESERSNPSPFTKIMPKKICPNGNRRSIRYESWNRAIAIRYDGNIVLLKAHNHLISSNPMSFEN